ncbi:MAG: hypothetical protein LBL76_08235 [Treponema sp.]|nr:hypothetical protein [Treponema sp.]
MRFSHKTKLSIPQGQNTLRGLLSRLLTGRTGNGESSREVKGEGFSRGVEGIGDQRTGHY